MIDSPSNPLVRDLLKLERKAGRDELGLFLVEGRRAIAGFLAAGWRPRHLLVRQGEAVPSGWPAAQAMSARVAERLSGQRSPSGYCAAFPLPAAPAPDLAAGGLVLCEIADPGNAGTLIRTAAAFAVPQVVLVGGCDPWSPKVVQASAGALAAKPPAILPAEPGLAALAGGAPLCGLLVQGGEPPHRLPARPRWLVVGGEADGIRPAWLPLLAERLTLPMPGGTESLNAAVAGAIALYALSAPARA